MIKFNKAIKLIKNTILLFSIIKVIKLFINMIIKIIIKLVNFITNKTMNVKSVHPESAGLKLIQGIETDESILISSEYINIGMKIIYLMFGTFMLWASLVSINSAAIAPGGIVLGGNKKTIQHYEGGIIKEIFVKDGDIVKKGDKIIQLDEISSKSGLEVLKKQLFSAKAILSRLSKERDIKFLSQRNEVSLIFEDEIFQNPSHELLEILNVERKLFKNRNESIFGQIEVLKKRIKQFEQEKEGLQSQRKSIESGIEFLNNELKSNYQLYRKNIISKSDYLQLKQKLAENEGEYGRIIANIAKTDQSISEAELQVINAKTNWTNKIIQDLQEVQIKIADLQERIKASNDILKRTTITAPSSGVITNMKFFTKGGVIPPNAQVLDIVPQNDDLLLEVQINPQDIDVVRVGLNAKVRLSAYKAKRVPALSGIVKLVSADIFTNQYTGAPYYKARIKIDEEEIGKLNNVDLYPGMQAQAFIITGSRTFLQYLFSPIVESFEKAFREE